MGGNGALFQNRFFIEERFLIILPQGVAFGLNLAATSWREAPARAVFFPQLEKKQK